MGVKRIGRDYTTDTQAKTAFLTSAKDLCRSLGLKFGAGDTEFIPHSDGGGCCSGAGYFLRQSNEFCGNVAGVISSSKTEQNIVFSDLYNDWTPSHEINTYLTTNSRTRINAPHLSDWLGLLAYRWNGKTSPYSPKFFAGVHSTENYDKAGFKIYTFKPVL